MKDKIIRLLVIVVYYILITISFNLIKNINIDSNEDVKVVTQEVVEEPTRNVETQTTTTNATTVATKKITKKKTTKKVKKKIVVRKKGNVTEYQNYAHELVISYGWSEEDFTALVNLWNRESGWNPYARNKKSGACGIPQSLPCSKMKSEGSDYKTNYKTQIRWGLKYIKNRYGSPSNAWRHFKRKGWY